MGISESIYWSEYERVDRECDKNRPPKPRSVLLDDAISAADRAEAEHGRELDQIEAAARYLRVVKELHPDLLPHLGGSNSKWHEAAGGRMTELRPARFRSLVHRIHVDGLDALLAEASAERDLRLKAAAEAEAAARDMPEDAAAETAWAKWLRASSARLDAIEYPGENRP